MRISTAVSAPFMRKQKMWQVSKHSFDGPASQQVSIAWERQLLSSYGSQILFFLFFFFSMTDGD